jgi:hypothetical protein
MKYVFTLLLIVSCTTHTGPSQSHQQRMPLQYIYITPTIVDNNSQNTVYTGKHSYVDFSDDSFKSAESPTQPYDICSVNIESADLSLKKDGDVKLPVKTILSIMYSIQKRTQSGTEEIQKSELLTLDCSNQNETSFKKVLPDLPYTLNIVVKRTQVPQK